MSLETMKRCVISYCDIPEKLTNGHHLSEFPCGCYVGWELPKEAPVDPDEDDEEATVDAWILGKYPELAGKKILIDIDY